LKAKRMSVKRKIVYVVLFLVGFVVPFLLINIITKGSVKGAINRFIFTPAIITNNHFVSVESTENPDEQRVKFMFAYQSKQGFYGLKKTFITIEGYPVVVFAATENGKLTIIRDYTLDKFGPRKFIKKEVDSVACEPVDANNPVGKSKSILKFIFKSSEFEKI
jgi:hypothetical protein